MRVTLSVILGSAALFACDSASTPGPAANPDILGGNDLVLPDATAPDTSTPETGTDVDGPTDTTAPDTTAPDAIAPNDTVPPSDTTVVPTGGIGSACSANADCGQGGTCLDLPGGYCSVANCSDASPCPSGASCWSLGDSGAYCLLDCQNQSECRGSDGYICDADNTCWQGTSSGGSSPVGGPCDDDADCKDPGAFCYPAVFDGEPTGFFAGYCMIEDCTSNSCPSGSTCEAIFVGGGTACVDACGPAQACGVGYACSSEGFCFPGCASSGCPTNYACDAQEDACVPACTAATCPQGTVCKADGNCGEPPCQTTGCGQGYVCADSGDCVPDLAGGPGAGPGPDCPNLPPRDCSGTAAFCGELLAFDPKTGPGYWDYPLNGETNADQYRSFARRDMQVLIKWATAMVDCKAKSWAGGNGQPLGLGDMSESNGAIPGTRENQPGHPEGTHVGGSDMDIAYYQTSAAPDNRLRTVCPHTQNGQDAYRCVSAPNSLDLWRSAYFIGLLFQSSRTRVIGVDGQIGPLVEQALSVLCADGWLTGTSCSNNRALAFETTNQGMGWYNFHHHHLHISLKAAVAGAPSLPGHAGQMECLIDGCPSDLMERAHLGCQHDLGPTRPALIPAPQGVTRLEKVERR